MARRRARRRGRASPRSVRTVNVRGHRRGPRAPNHGRKRKKTHKRGSQTRVAVKPYVRAKPHY